MDKVNLKLNFSIIGRGFGLYGYLPAIKMIENTVVHLPENYKEILIKRKELSKFIEKIIWHEDKEELFKSIEYLVIAVSPESQFLILKNTLNYKNIKNYLLEKPPAKDPLEAKYLLEMMKESNSIFQFGFSFLNCQWYEKVSEKILSSEFSSKINWTFKAHHFSNNLENWKKNHNMGGGAIRFYGIHIIAMVAKLGFKGIIFSKIFKDEKNNFYRWLASFKISTTKNLIINLNTNDSIKRFEIFESESNKNILDIEDPFSLEIKKYDQDIRVDLLSKLVSQSIKTEVTDYAFYKLVINIWTLCEKEALVIHDDNHY